MTSIQCGVANYLEALPNCFLQFTNRILRYNSVCPYPQVQINNNSAGRDGNSLYGGLLDRCRMKSINTDDLIAYIFVKNSTVQMLHNNNTAISSQPYSMHFCNENGTHDFSISIRNFTVSIIALAQGGIGVATEVTAVLKSTARLKLGQNRQTLSNECTTISIQAVILNRSFCILKVHVMLIVLIVHPRLYST